MTVQPTPSPLRRIPKSKTSEDTVKAILDATSSLLVEVGYEGVNTNAIAKRAGVAPPTIYHFFPNKFAIFFELANRLQAGVEIELAKVAQKMINNPITGFDEAVPLVNAFVETIAQYWRANPALAPLWHGEWTAHGDVPPAIAFKARTVEKMMTIIPAFNQFDHGARYKIFCASITLVSGFVSAATLHFRVGDHDGADFLVLACKQALAGYLRPHFLPL
jgi:AcrR family transcriptional regulator